MFNCQERLEAAFRQATVELASGPAGPGRSVTADTVRAWLVLHQVLGGRRWLDASEAAISSLDPSLVAADQLADWLVCCCEAWVLRATGPFRQRADALTRNLVDSPGASPALLARWRISGDRQALQRGLAAIPKDLSAGDLEGVAACWAGYRATADESYREAAAQALTGLAPHQIPLGRWPLAADILGWGCDEVEEAVSAWDDAQDRKPTDIIQAAAALALPTLELWIEWWFDDELREGIVAEAATYPYPALRLRFRRLPDRDQVRFTPILAGYKADTLHDAAVVTAHLEQVLEEVDFSRLRGAPRRTSPGGRRSL